MEVETVDVCVAGLLSGRDRGRQRGDALDDLPGAVAGGDVGGGSRAGDGGEQGLAQGEGIEIVVVVEPAEGFGQFFPLELEALIHYNGFEVLHTQGDFDGGPLDEEAESQIYLCRLTRR